MADVTIRTLTRAARFSVRCGEADRAAAVPLQHGAPPPSQAEGQQRRRAAGQPNEAHAHVRGDDRSAAGERRRADGRRRHRHIFGPSRGVRSGCAESRSMSA